MSVDAAKLRTDFPEFADVAKFPGTMVDYWLAIAAKLVANAARWGSLQDVGIEMFTAHNLVLERRAMDEAARGKVPGMSTGIKNSQSVDKVSVGYDTQGGAEMDAGHWNLTIYGTRYIRLARTIGAGPVQVGAPNGAVSVSAAWPGPNLP